MCIYDVMGTVINKKRRNSNSNYKGKLIKPLFKPS